MQAAISQTTLQSLPPNHPSQLSFRRSVWFIVLIAFFLRLAVIVVGHTYRINPLRDHFNFGWEMGRIARSIVQNKGFSSPTDLDTGPTAWAAPIYPYLMAAVFKLFGVYTRLSAFVILTFNSLVASLTCWTLFRIGNRAYNETVGRAAAWTWAVFPYIVYWPVRIIWEVSLSTFLLSLALWLTIRLADESRSRDWIIYGLLWGLILLTNTTLVILLPFFLAWLLYWSPKSSEVVTGASTCLVVALLCITPWSVRNYREFQRFIFVRDNLPLELHESNNQASAGLWTRTEHPGNDPVAMRHFQALGELRFMDEKNSQVHEFIRQHPGEFFLFDLERVWYFWAAPPQFVVLGGYDLGFARHVEFLLAAIFAFAGLVLTFKRRNRYAWLLAPFLLAYPLPYYLVNPFQRYKHPIETVMLLLIVYLLWESRGVRLSWRLERANR
ncbi:MAG TPA: glycosyltransferase family 39 protein [Terriglobales bacterium]|nr:glycosyltransferase family 39 protein [Terriglobales bacterium]